MSFAHEFNGEYGADRDNIERRLRAIDVRRAKRNLAPITKAYTEIHDDQTHVLVHYADLSAEAYLYYPIAPGAPLTKPQITRADDPHLAFYRCAQCAVPTQFWPAAARKWAATKQ